MRLCRALSLGALLMFGGTGAASANPITWNFDNVVFGDGTTVTGSFVFDADAMTFGSLNMTTSGGTSVPSGSAWFFDTACAGCQQNSNGIAGFLAVNSANVNLAGAQVISLFSTAGPLLTNAGGAIGLEFAIAGTCVVADCASFDPGLPNSQILRSGQFVSDVTAVPEPASLILLATGLGATRLFRKTRRPRA